MEKEKKKGLFRVCTTIESEEEGPPPNFSLSLFLLLFSGAASAAVFPRETFPPSKPSFYFPLSLSLFVQWIRKEIKRKKKK